MAPDPEPHHAGAAREAYYWAVAASTLKAATEEREAARKLSTPGDLSSLSEWHRWLLRNLDLSITPQRALELAEMWTRVAAVQERGPRCP